MSLCLSGCLHLSFGRKRERLDGFAQLFLEVVGEVQGSVSLIPNNHFDVFEVKHVNKQ